MNDQLYDREISLWREFDGRREFHWLTDWLTSAAIASMMTHTTSSRYCSPIQPNDFGQYIIYYQNEIGK